MTPMPLFLDVDGTLLPFGSAGPYPVYDAPAAVAAQPAVHPLLDRIDPAFGPRLRALGCELVWATTWLDDANTCVAPRLGLPPLPVVDWPDEEEPPGVNPLELWSPSYAASPTVRPAQYSFS